MRGPIVFILINLTIDAMGIGLILPVMPGLLREVTGGDLAEAALWGGILVTTFAVMQFLFGPLMGNLSDRFGRRPVLLVSLAVMAADYVVMALASSLWLLFAARIVGGITAATQSTAYAFIADISTPEEKAARVGRVGAAVGAGVVLGPLIGGLLAEYGTRAPFWAAAGLTTANLIFGALVLPETVTDRIRRPFRLARSNPLGAFRQMGRLPGLRAMLLLLFAYEFAFIVYPATWAYFGPAAFGWSPGMVGISLAGFGISMAVVQGGLIRIALRHLGERGTIYYGILFNAAVFLVLSVLTNGWIALAFTPVTALGAVVTPALQGLMSRTAGDDQQGELQGAVASVKAVAAILSPVTMTAVFYAFTTPPGLHLPGAAFVLSAGLMGVCGLIWIFGARPATLPGKETL